MPDEVLSSPQRQSPLGLVFETIDVVRNFSRFNLAVLAAFVFARRFSPFLIGAVLVGLIAVVVWSALSWWKFVFCVEGDQLVVRRGVLSDERLVIPLGRIQSISVEQPALHRLVGLVKVGVETAGTSAVEFEIDAVSASVARSLQQVAESHGARLGSVPGSESQMEGPPSPGLDNDSGEVLVKRSLGELVAAAVSRLPLAGVVGLGSLAPFMDRIFGRIESLNLELSPTLIVVMVVIVGLLLWLVNITQEVVRNWGLTVVRSGAGLLRSAGMFSRTSRSTTIERVQALQTTANVVERRLNIRRIVLRTIGSGDLHISGATTEELSRFRELVLGSSSPIVADRNVSRWLMYYELRAVPLVLIAMAAAAVVYRSPLVFVGLVGVVWIVVRAVVRWKYLRWGLDDGRIAVSDSLLSRRRVEQRLVTFQTVTLRRSWLERRRGLATLVLASAENRLVVPMIDDAEAAQVRDVVVATLAIDRSPWM